MFTLSIEQTVSEAVQTVGNAIATFLSWLIGLLPDDPYKLSEVLAVPQAVRNVLGFVNWLVPIGRCVELILVWFGVVAGIWFIRFLLKLIHVI